MLRSRWHHSTLGAVLFAIAACATNARPLSSPTTTDELLSNLKVAFADDRLFDDAFYVEPTVKSFLGGTKVSQVYAKEGRPPFTTFFIGGFDAMVPPMPWGTGGGALQGLRAEIFKVTSDGQEHGKIARVRVFLEIHSGDNHLEAEHVMGIFGYPWQEDREAENQVFIAITREPFNPPARTPYIVHCAWTEHGYAKVVELNFGADDRLWTFNFSASRK
jgi:hypothetical protein